MLHSIVEGVSPPLWRPRYMVESSDTSPELVSLASGRGWHPPHARTSVVPPSLSSGQSPERPTNQEWSGADARVVHAPVSRSSCMTTVLLAGPTSAASNRAPSLPNAKPAHVPLKAEASTPRSAICTPSEVRNRTWGNEPLEVVEW